MKPTEAEILEVTKFKPRKKYKSRNEYLIALVKAVDKLPLEKFNYLISNQGYSWYTEAANAFLAEQALPEFPEVTIEELRYPRDEEDYVPPKLPIITPEEHQKNVKAFLEAHEAADAALAKLQEAAEKIKPKRHSKYRLADPSEGARHYLFPEVDRFGLLRGSLRQKAAEMFERGATMKEVRGVVGHTLYNLLKKLRGDGHRIVNVSGVIKLTHKADFNALEK